MDNTKHWLNVRQGSFHVMGSRWNSHYGAKGRGITKQINDKGGDFFFFQVGRGF